MSTHARRGLIGTVIVLFLLFLLLLAPTVTNAASDNLLANPSFEGGAGNYRTYGNGRFDLVSNAHSGKKAYRIVREQKHLGDEYGRLTSVIAHNKVANAEKLRFTTWLKTNGGREDVELVLNFWSKQEDYLGQSRRVVQAKSSWHQYAVTAGDIPSNAVYARVEIRLRGAGTVFIDDLVLIQMEGNSGGTPPPEETPPPPSSGGGKGCDRIVKVGQSIQAGIDLLKPGQTLCVGAGTYREILSIRTENVILRAQDPKRQPILDGDYKLPNVGDSLPQGCPYKVGARTVHCYTFAPLVDIRASGVTVDGFVITESRGRCVRIWDRGKPLRNVTIRNSKITQCRQAGIGAVGPTYNLLIENNDISWTANFAQFSRSAAKLNWPAAVSTDKDGSGFILRGNNIHENFGEGIHNGNGVGYRNILIEDNTFWDNYAGQVYVHAVSNVVVQRNLVYHTGNKRFFRGGAPSDCIIVNSAERAYGNSTPAKQIRIVNNLVSGCKNNISFWNARTGIHNVTVAHNTLVNATQEGIRFLFSHSDDFSNVQFVNNIIYQANGVPVFGTGVSKRDGRYFNELTFKGNLWSAAPSELFGLFDNDRVGNPKLQGGNWAYPASYKLRADSPAVNAGVSAGIPTDFWRLGRSGRADIGAHER